MGNVMAASPLPPLPGDLSKAKNGSVRLRGNPGPMEELHKKCKG